MIDKLEQHVDEFMRDAGQVVLDTPGVPEQAARNLRLRLLEEEMLELRATLRLLDDIEELPDNIDKSEVVIEVADALADIIYVAVGGFRAFGIKGSRVMDEVCRSNDTKRDPETGGFNLDARGKVTKPKHFEHPDLRSIIYP